MTNFPGVDAAEHGAAALEVTGMTRMPARTLMAMVGSPDAGYTAAELAERLQVSPAAVSGALRYLQDNRMIQRLSRPGERVTRYNIADDSWTSFMTHNCPTYVDVAEFIDQIADLNVDAPISVARARTTALFFRFLASRLPELVEEWHAISEAAEAEGVPPALARKSPAAVV